MTKRAFFSLSNPEKVRTNLNLILKQKKKNSSKINSYYRSVQNQLMIDNICLKILRSKCRQIVAREFEIERFALLV